VSRSFTTDVVSEGDRARQNLPHDIFLRDGVHVLARVPRDTQRGAPTRAGGGTHFRALDLLVEARAGRLLTWKELVAGGTNDSMTHAGTPVSEGEKITLVTWQRQRRFRP
jgi:hypothetical protein